MKKKLLIILCINLFLSILHAEEAPKMITLQSLGLTPKSRNIFVEDTKEALEAVLVILEFENEINNYNININILSYGYGYDAKADLRNFLKQLSSYSDEAKAFYIAYQKFQSIATFGDFAVRHMLNVLANPHRDKHINHFLVYDKNKFVAGKKEILSIEIPKEKLKEKIAIQKEIIDAYIDRHSSTLTQIMQFVDKAEQIKQLEEDDDEDICAELLPGFPLAKLTN